MLRQDKKISDHVLKRRGILDTKLRPAGLLISNRQSWSGPRVLRYLLQLPFVGRPSWPTTQAMQVILAMLLLAKKATGKNRCPAPFVVLLDNGQADRGQKRVPCWTLVACSKQLVCRSTVGTGMVGTGMVGSCDETETKPESPSGRVHFANTVAFVVVGCPQSSGCPT